MFEEIFNNNTPQDYIISLMIMATGVIIGTFIQFIVVRKFSQLTKKSRNSSDDRIIKAIGNSPLFFSILISLFLTSISLGLSASYRSGLNSFLIATGILIGTSVLARISTVGVETYLQNQSGGGESSSLFKNVGRIITYVIGLLVISQTLGIDITAALTALGVGGIAVALALQDTLSNLFAGFYIIAARKIVPGDYIELSSGERGYVEDISWRNTTVRTLQNYIIIIPNAILSTVILTNYDLPITDVAILMNVGISYDSDLDFAEKITIEVAREVMREVEGGIKDYEPFIRYNEYGDSSINFTVIMRGKTYVDKYLINHEFIKRLHKRYRQEGIEFPFPQLDVTLKNPVKIEKS